MKKFALLATLFAALCGFASIAKAQTYYYGDARSGVYVGSPSVHQQRGHRGQRYMGPRRQMHIVNPRPRAYYRPQPRIHALPIVQTHARYHRRHVRAAWTRTVTVKQRVVAVQRPDNVPANWSRSR